MERYSGSHAVRKMQTKTTRSGTLTTNAGEDTEQQELSSTAGGNAEYSHSGRELPGAAFYKTQHTLLTTRSRNHTLCYSPKAAENCVCMMCL